MKNKHILIRNCFLKSHLAAFLAILVPPASFAHEVRVHEAITYAAWASAAQLSPNYQAFSLTITPPDGSGMFFSGGTNRSDVEWLAVGSAREDDIEDPPNRGGKRPLNHFYDPLSGQGLSESPPSIFTPIGRDSFDWGWLFNSPGVDTRFVYNLDANLGTVNQWSWQNARGFEWTGLTYPDPAGRSDNLAKTFRALGDVIHLLQDTTQPQHVRNEQHLSYWWSPYRSVIEKYGLKNKLNYTGGLLDWRAAGFTKLQDFWDRNLYVWDRTTPTVRNAQPLIDSEDPAQPTKKLGLAEFVNGNFIGSRHTYRELIATSSPFHYPFPSLNEGTDWNNLIAHPETYGKTSVTLLGVGSRYIVGKTGQGRLVTHHGAVSYLVAYNPDLNLQSSTFYTATVDDPDVLHDYHDILIPEAIKYSAGLLDYMFRGQLDVTATWDTVLSNYKIHITNKSGQDFQGGAFTFMRDNGDHVRAIVPLTLSYPGTLANNATLDGTYNLTEGGEKHILIYQGTIGVNNGTALDPVDAGMAIAAKALTVTGGGCECYDHQAQGRLSQTVVTGGVAVSGINSLYTPNLDSHSGASGTGSFKLYGGCGGATYSIYVSGGNIAGDSTSLTGGGLSISLEHGASVRQNLVLGPCETANMFFVWNAAGPTDAGGYLDFCCATCCTPPTPCCTN